MSDIHEVHDIDGLKAISAEDPSIHPDLTGRARLLARGLIEFMYGLDARNDDDDWDMPPVFGLVYAETFPIDLSSGNEAAIMGFSFSPLEIPIRIWNMYDRVHHSLLHASQPLRSLRAMAVRPPFPENCVAVMLINEAWGLKGGMTEADEAAAHARQLHEHPNRIEMRLFQAVDINGNVTSLFSERDSISWHMAGPLGPRSMNGDVPVSLAYLLSILQGKETPDWEDFSPQFYPSDEEGSDD